MAHDHLCLLEVMPADYVDVKVADRRHRSEAYAFDDVRPQKCLAHIQR